MSYRIAVFSHDYPIETSPTIKGIIAYLSQKYSSVDVIVNTLDKTLPISFPSNVNTLLIVPSAFYSIFHLIGKLIVRIPYVARVHSTYIKLYRNLAKYLVRKTMSSKSTQYDLVYCVEIHSLFLLKRADFALSTIIYLSLESDQIVKEYDRHEAADLISQCSIRIIQSKERGDGFSRFLNRDLKYEYLPVSRIPAGRRVHVTEADIEHPRIIYSGYFADWSCLAEFLEVYNLSLYLRSCLLTIQGHAVGTETYFLQLRNLAQNNSQITFDEKYYSDDKHLDLLSRHHVGLALYRVISGSENWAHDTLIYSSGKIATYLWAGLAIITNLKSELTQHPPFLYIEDITSKSLEDALHCYARNSLEYNKAAWNVANNHFNLFHYMDNIENQLTKVLRK